MRFLISIMFVVLATPAFANPDYIRCRAAGNTSAQCAAYLPQCQPGQRADICEIAKGGAESQYIVSQRKQQKAVK